jgi:hypothetical protein
MSNLLGRNTIYHYKKSRITGCILKLHFDYTEALLALQSATATVMTVTRLCQPSQSTLSACTRDDEMIRSMNPDTHSMSSIYDGTHILPRSNQGGTRLAGKKHKIWRVLTRWLTYIIGAGAVMAAAGNKSISVWCARLLDLKIRRFEVVDSSFPC